MLSVQTEPMVKVSNHVQNYSQVNKVYTTSDLNIFTSFDTRKSLNRQY